MKQAFVDAAEVVALLKGDAEDVLALLLGRDVVRVHGDDVVVPLLLGLQNLQGLGGVIRGDDAVGDLVFQVTGGVSVADIAEGRPVAVGAEAVRPPGPDVGAGHGGKVGVGLHEEGLAVLRRQGQAQGRPGGGNVLEAGGGGQARGLPQLPHQLPGVEGVQEVDVPRAAVQHPEGQISAPRPGEVRGLLVGVAAVFQFEFLHWALLKASCA